ncbi:MAG: hypothetical protein KAH64_03865 [Nitrosomonadaceae bacterium]|nr:hypothetical protein [Nitrosomonadaceae bacterium]
MAKRLSIIILLLFGFSSFLFAKTETPLEVVNKHLNSLKIADFETHWNTMSKSNQAILLTAFKTKKGAFSHLEIMRKEFLQWASYKTELVSSEKNSAIVKFIGFKPNKNEPENPHLFKLVFENNAWKIK